MNVRRYFRRRIVLTLLLLYGVRYYAAIPRSTPAYVGAYIGGVVQLEAVIVDPVEDAGGVADFSVEARSIQAGKNTLPVHGTIRIRTSLHGEEVVYGDRVRIRGALESYFRPDPRVAASMKNPTIRVLEHGKGNRWSAYLFQIRGWLSGRISSLFPDPASGFAAGILLGSRASIPKYVVDDFRRAGLTHVLALSGFNIIILIQCIEAMCSIFPRRIAALLTLLLIGSFTIMVGASASVVRAAVMGSLGVCARLFGRKTIGLRTLFLTGYAMAMIDPFVVIWDIGFQLSFGATAGILLFARPWQKRLTKIPETFGIRDSLVTTTAAQVFTFPLLVWYFHSFSLISFVSNVVVLPFIPILMLGSFVSIFFGPLVAAPTYVIFRLVLFLIHLFAYVPFGFIDWGMS